MNHHNMWKEIWQPSYANVPRTLTYKLVRDTRSSHNVMGYCT